MKAPNQDFFYLFKSLNRGEKSFLTKYLKLHTKKDDSAIIKLFDMLEDQQTYDEDKCIAKLDASRNAYAVLKNQAHQLMLNALFIRESEQTTRATLYKKLVLAEYHLRNANIEGCEKLCNEVIKEGNEYGLHTIVIDAYEIKNKLIRHELHLDKIEKYCEEGSIFTKLQDLQQAVYMRYYYDIISTHILKEPDLKGEKAQQHLAKAEAYAETIQNPLGLESERLFWQLRLMIASGHRSISSIMLMKKTFQFYENHPKLLREHFHEYLMLNVLFYYLYSKLGDKQALDTQCDRLRTIAASGTLDLSQTLLVQTEIRIFNMQINFCLENGMMAALDQHMQAYQAYFLQYEDLPGSLDYMWFCHLSSYYAFVNQKYSEAHKWIYKQINSPYYPERTISHPVTRLYLLFLHYDMQNFDYLRHELQNTKRYFSIRNLHEQIELVIIKNMLNIIDGADESATFELLRQELGSKAYKRYLTVNIVDHFNFEAWLMSKIKGVPFRDTMTTHKPFYLRFFRPFLKPIEDLPNFILKE